MGTLGREAAIGVLAANASATTMLPAADAYYQRAQKLAAVYRDRNVVRIVALLEEAAAFEHPDALFELGNWYHYGIGVAHDDAKAAGLWERASAGGRGEATFNLAIACERGIGVPKDDARAYALYVRCLETGEANAYYEVGRCLHYGIGTAADPATASTYFAQARACGHGEAICDAAEGDGPRRMPRPNVAGPFHATRGG